jgi:parvulin-like peptidyl-prolyl isomerase
MPLVLAGAFFGRHQESNRTGSVVAKVNGWSISLDRVRRHVARTIPNHDTYPGEALKRLLQEAAEHLINRQVVYAYLQTTNSRVESVDINTEIELTENRLEQTGKTLADHLKNTGLTSAEFENEVAWKVAWDRYLLRTLTPQFLSEHYETHRRRFDGTKLNVAHIFLSARDDAADVALRKADMIRLDITTGKSSWEDAVVKYSESSTSKENGGLIGWIQFNQPMPPTFSRAAFDLQSGEISPPVRTGLGVHLIRCLDVQAGSIGLQDAMTAVREDAAKYLFEKIAAEHRASVTVESTFDWSRDLMPSNGQSR